MEISLQEYFNGIDIGQTLNESALLIIEHNNGNIKQIISYGVRLI